MILLYLVCIIRSVRTWLAGWPWVWLAVYCITPLAGLLGGSVGVGVVGGTAAAVVPPYLVHDNSV